MEKRAFSAEYKTKSCTQLQNWKKEFLDNAVLDSARTRWSVRQEPTSRPPRSVKRI